VSALEAVIIRSVPRGVVGERKERRLFCEGTRGIHCSLGERLMGSLYQVRDKRAGVIRPTDENN